MQVPETRYARSGDLRLAYQVFGEGPRLLSIPPLLSNVEVVWEHEYCVRVLERLGRHFTVVHFDKRGIGLSDRPEGLPTLTERIADIAAVMDAVGWDRSHLFGMSEGGLMAQLFAAHHPDRVDRLYLHNTGAPARYARQLADVRRDGDAPVVWPQDIFAGFAAVLDGWPENAQTLVDWFMPSVRDNESFVRWQGRVMRLSASPKDFRRQVEGVMMLDAGDAPERIVSPTLITHNRGDRVMPIAHARLLAELIPGSRLVELDGDDHFSWVSANWRESIDGAIEFLSGSAARTTSSRRFATVLFTDIVASTSQSAALGDDGWRSVLDGHDRLARRLIAEHGGRVVKSTGDGLLAVFDMPSAGVGCGRDLCRELAGIGVQIRAGVHAGEIEVHDDGDISGIAVNLAARVEQRAGDGELWASSTVRDMLLGGTHTFTDQGEHTLKGIDGQWRLFSIDLD